MSLGPFPVDDMTLDMIETALYFCLTIDEETGDPVRVNPDMFSIHELCEFLSGVVGDPLGVVEHGENISYDPRHTHTQKDIILSLIAEVRRLRNLEPDGTVEA